MTTESPDGAIAVTPSYVVDDVGVVWSLSSTGAVLRNGYHKYVWTGNLLLWTNRQLYVASFTDRGYALNRNTGGAYLLAPDDPLMEVLVPKSRIDSFAVAPTSVLSGNLVTVSWTTSYGKRAFLDGVPVALSGTFKDRPTVSHSYRLVVQGKGPDAVSTTSVVVTTSTPAQTIDSFTVTPSSITAGQTDVIAWQTSNATQVTLDGVSVAAAGSKSEIPASSVTHTLVAQGSAAQVSRSASVSVAAAPPINHPPVWQSVPDIKFTQGTASSFSVAQYVSDPDGDPLTFTLESGTLPAGVVFDASGARFFYDGRAMGAISGNPAIISGLSVGANDGK